MKKILYWTLAGSTWYTRYSVFGVTSEGPRARVNGRFADGFPSHTTKNFCRGRFETQEQVTAALDGLRAIDARYEERLRPHTEAIAAIRREQSREIDEYLRSLGSADSGLSSTGAAA